MSELNVFYAGFLRKDSRRIKPGFRSHFLQVTGFLQTQNTVISAVLYKNHCKIYKQYLNNAYRVKEQPCYIVRFCITGVPTFCFIMQINQQGQCVTSKVWAKSFEILLARIAHMRTPCKERLANPINFRGPGNYSISVTIRRKEKHLQLISDENRAV